MKKILLIAVLVLGTMTAHAQFEQGKWLINPSITGLDFTYSKSTDVNFGINARAGAFLVDNVALLVNLGGEFMEDYKLYLAGVGGRYYINSIGLYVGAGFDISHYRVSKDNHTDLEVVPEVGYAFFLSRTVTLEPSIYYRWNTKDNDLSTFGVRIGFGLYF